MSKICMGCNKRIMFWRLVEEGYHINCLRNKLTIKRFDFVNQMHTNIGEATQIYEDLCNKQLKVEKRIYRVRIKSMAVANISLAPLFVFWSLKMLYSSFFDLFNEVFSYSSMLFNSFNVLINIALMTLWVYNFQRGVKQLKELKKDKQEDLFEELLR